MSVCKYCGWIGGYHAAGCASKYAAQQYVTVRTNNTTTPPPTRVEYFGRLQVHQPVPAPKPQENTK